MLTCASSNIYVTPYINDYCVISAHSFGGWSVVNHEEYADDGYNMYTFNVIIYSVWYKVVVFIQINMVINIWFVDYKDFA